MAAIENAKRIVIKIGSALLVDAQSGRLRLEWLQGLAADITALRDAGGDVVLVSSGSIALGRRVLKLGAGELSLEQSQAAAAVGQIKLAQAYENVLSPDGHTTAQILLTLEDSADRRRYLNSRRTMAALLDLGVVPIVNENDTVATDEIRYGDNDRLAAQVATMIGADLLVLLSDIDGLYTGNPRIDPDARHIPVIDEITPALEAAAGDAGTSASKGGMKTKLMAAKSAMSAGCAMVIIEGDCPRPITALKNGATHSWFTPRSNPRDARKNWISGMKPKGTLVVDAGAISALQSGKSLLPVGVRKITGAFTRGELVSICDSEGRELAKGLSNYKASEAAKIIGRQTGEIKEILGYAGHGAVVHRDDLVL
ncbi:glutamate 5-kinase [Amylibacter marinus]|uniref:Glutamate 5-kinase n=1 Tax=Amylibacter marinus TaxID=1475483 RepID=A0ABQ5VT98_9RHOB|nr:glutamate 5-kinase [Amylibacter marinus]GLQ34443.1 glutamate 5-kinase [Amylibacter marinus]